LRWRNNAQGAKQQLASLKISLVMGHDRHGISSQGKLNQMIVRFIGKIRLARSIFIIPGRLKS
jgi:hypothetical protein